MAPVRLPRAAQQDRILTESVGVVALERMRIFDVAAGALDIMQRDTRLRARQQRLHFDGGRQLLLRLHDGARKACLGLAHPLLADGPGIGFDLA